MLTVSPSQALLVPALSICCCLSALLHPIYLPLNLLPLLVVIGCHRDLGQNQTTLSQRRKAVLVRDGRQTHLNRLEGVSAVGAPFIALLLFGTFHPLGMVAPNFTLTQHGSDSWYLSVERRSSLRLLLPANA